MPSRELGLGLEHAFLGSIIQPITITKLDSTALEPRGRKKEIEAMGLIHETIQEVDVEREEKSLTNIYGTGRGKETHKGTEKEGQGDKRRTR